ncbi:MBL fold metallo-hydrolase [Nocardia pseudovaccinii]|uniref:MBL fold metallo-hydrolase n=1 Tax=Nocardia pseudovaccinii TaxID=189540 RepID=UPI0007A3BCF8|nr:MBL fold metallo-hydrolase [Nocardia pseudovaccinii]
MKVGSIGIVPVLDGSGREIAREVLSRTGEQRDPWLAHEDLLDSQGNLELQVGGYLIRAGDRTILVDTGVGTIDNGKYRGGQFLESLKLQGVEPTDVTDVVLTHLHFDHVGWATKKGMTVFENATYRVHQADWEHFVESPDAEPGAVRKLAPLSDRLELFGGDTTLAPGIDVRHAPGHTPGSTVLIVSMGRERAALVGDLAHAPMEFTESNWQFAFDFDPEQATATRAEFVAEFADTGTAVLAAHFPGLRAGRLVTRAGRIEWTYDMEETV